MCSKVFTGSVRGGFLAAGEEGSRGRRFGAAPPDVPKPRRSGGRRGSLSPDPPNGPLRGMQAKHGKGGWLHSQPPLPCFAALSRTPSAVWCPGRARALEGFHCAPRLGVEDAPVDELFGQFSGRPVVDDRQRTQILLADGQHPAVVVAALALDGGHVTGEGPGLRLGQLLHAVRVDDELGRRTQRGGCGLARQKLRHRHAVELGEVGQLLDRDRAVTALVGTDDDSLPPPLRLLLYSVQGQSLLRTDGTQSGTQSFRVFRWWHSFVLP